MIRSKRSEDLSVLDSIAASEMDEVDNIMEDITDEILDLQQESNPCSISNHEINCNSTIYTNKAAWKNSRTFVNEQIRQLRAQLNELKQIRSHLKVKRPNLGQKFSSCRCGQKLKRNRSLIKTLRRQRRKKLRMERKKARALRKASRVKGKKNLTLKFNLKLI